MASETESQEKGSREKDEKAKQDRALGSLDNAHDTVNTEDDSDTEVNQRQKAKEHSCDDDDDDDDNDDVNAEERDDDELTEAKDCDDVKAKVNRDDVDPLSVDLYDRLRAESDEDQSDFSQWDNYIVCDDLQVACKRLSCTEKQFYAILMSVFVAMTFAMVFGLFVLQAQLAFSSHEILTKVQSAKKDIPQSVYDLYFDYLENSQLDKVDLRANTSIFVH